MNQEQAWLNFVLTKLAVNREADLLFHGERLRSEISLTMLIENVPNCKRRGELSARLPAPERPDAGRCMVIKVLGQGWWFSGG
jgi:hypothetical protein